MHYNFASKLDHLTWRDLIVIHNIFFANNIYVTFCKLFDAQINSKVDKSRDFKLYNFKPINTTLNPHNGGDKTTLFSENL